MTIIDHDGNCEMTNQQHPRLRSGPQSHRHLAVTLCLAFLTLLPRSLHGFQTPFRRRSSSNGVGSSSALTTASSPSRGMGMAGKRSGKNDRSSKKGSAATKAASAPPFDVSASLLRLEKTYDRLLLEASKRQQQHLESDDEYEIDDTTTAVEYVVAARDGKVLPDWVPVAQLIVVNVQDGLVQSALSSFCREIHHVAGLACNTFRSIPRQALEYSVEPAESFYKFVYDAVVERSAETSMTTAEARRVLGIDDASGSGGTLSDLKRRYRARSFECHPDRVRHSDLDEGGRERTAIEYSQVQLAYETLLGSGSVRREGRTWYESLGGRERTEFRATALLPLRQAEQKLRGAETALVGLDPSLVQGFVARSLASKQQL